MSLTQQICKENAEWFYGEMNSMAEGQGTVFFGTDLFARLPFGELVQSFHMEERVYNRSVKGMNIRDAAELLQVCVMDLKPAKVFLHLGDTDIQAADFDLDAFIAQYEWILYTLHTQSKATAFVVSLVSDSPKAAAVNRRLKELAAESGTSYIDISGARNLERPDLHVFDMMKYYIRSHPMRFSDAMEFVAL